jgi:hypothetical protein
MLLNTAKDTPPLNKSLSLKLGTFTFTLLLGHYLLFFQHNFTKLSKGQENTQQITQQFKHN